MRAIKTASQQLGYCESKYIKIQRAAVTSFQNSKESSHWKWKVSVIVCFPTHLILSEGEEQKSVVLVWLGVVGLHELFSDVFLDRFSRSF